MLLAKFAKIRWTRKISVLQYVDLPLLSFFYTHCFYAVLVQGCMIISSVIHSGEIDTRHTKLYSQLLQ